MSVGLGIFLGSLFLGTVILYLKMRNIWNWRAIWKRVGLIGLGFVVLLVTIVGGVAGYNEWEDRPQLVTAIDGISLGEKVSDIVFRHGQFKNEPSEDGADSSERFVSEDKRIILRAKSGTVERVLYLCKDEPDFKSAGRVSCGDAGERVLSRYGNGVKVQCSTKSKEGGPFALQRVYDVAEFGIRYFLYKNKVVGFMVMDRQEFAGATGVNWTACA